MDGVVGGRVGLFVLSEYLRVGNGKGLVVRSSMFAQVPILDGVLSVVFNDVCVDGFVGLL